MTIFIEEILNIWYNTDMVENTFDNYNDVVHGRGYIYFLQYHVVWVTKYRKKILTGKIESDFKIYLSKLLENLDIVPLSMEIMPDHIHLLISCKPQHRLSDIIKILKGNTSHWVFSVHPELKHSLWGGHLWNPTYFIVTISDRTQEQIQNYIFNQKIVS